MREPSQDSILPTPIPEKQKGPSTLICTGRFSPYITLFSSRCYLVSTSRATEASNLPETCIN